jgi:hypothetical protein
MLSNACFRNLMGEQLESLTFREVQQLEHRIDSALRNVRSRKVHVTCTLIVLQTYRSTVNCYSHRTSVLTVTVQVFFFFCFQDHILLNSIQELRNKASMPNKEFTLTSSKT